MNIVLFLGTKIGYEALETLIENEATISSVYVDSEHVHEIERYADRIVDLCDENKITVFRDVRLKDITLELKNEQIDLLMCFGFRRMLPKEMIKNVKVAALSTHFSLLPEYRGFAPVNWAIINDESRCGVSLFHMEKEMDSGDLVSQREVFIEKDEYISEVIDKCINELKYILKAEWSNFKQGIVKRIPQDDSKATYTCARNQNDGLIDWNKSTESIYNLIRGISHPFPGAFTTYDGEKIIILEAEPYDVGKYIGSIPGKVIKILDNEGVVVLTGNGAILIKIIKKEVDMITLRSDKLIKSVRITLGSFIIKK